MTFDLALLVYCTLAFGIHGGEFISGVSRQTRNLLCALPFALVSFVAWHCPTASIIAFLLAYSGSNMGFDNWPLWLKGLITLPLGGSLALPLAYWIGDKTRWKNVISEYLSGFLYGLILIALLRV